MRCMHSFPVMASSEAVIRSSYHDHTSPTKPTHSQERSCALVSTSSVHITAKTWLVDRRLTVADWRQISA